MKIKNKIEAATAPKDAIRRRARKISVEAPAAKADLPKKRIKRNIRKRLRNLSIKNNENIVTPTLHVDDAH